MGVRLEKVFGNLGYFRYFKSNYILVFHITVTVAHSSTLLSYVGISSDITFVWRMILVSVIIVSIGVFENGVYSEVGARIPRAEDVADDVVVEGGRLEVAQRTAGTYRRRELCVEIV